MKRLMMISLMVLLSACAQMPMQQDGKMDCCMNMKDGQMCPSDGTPCKMVCCKKMDGMMMKDGMKCDMECCKKMQNSAAKTTTKTVVKKSVAAPKPAPTKEEGHSAHH